MAKPIQALLLRGLYGSDLGVQTVKVVRSLKPCQRTDELQIRDGKNVQCAAMSNTRRARCHAAGAGAM